MGTFAGHVIPGTFFLVFSLWWTWAVWTRFFRTWRHVPVDRSRSRRSNVGFRAVSTYPLPCCPRFPSEGIFKVTAATIGIVGETVTGFRNGQFVNLMNLQHIAMFFFFAMNGLVDILSRTGVPMPEGSDYVTMALALAVEWLLFYFHLHGRSMLDVHVHTLLTVIIAASALVVLLEMKFRNQALCSLFRAVFAMFQGTWFFQIAFILHNPIPGAAPWDEDSHDQMMQVTAIFAAHLAGAVIFVSLSGALIYALRERLSAEKRTLLEDGLAFHLLAKNGTCKSSAESPLSDEEC